MSPKRPGFFFEINNSPKRKKSIEPPGILILAPFTAAPTIDFKSIPVNAPAVRVLIVKNPSPSNVSVELELSKGLIEKKFSFSETKLEIAPNSDAIVNISWTPSEAGNWRDTVKVNNLSGRHRFSHIVLTSSSVAPKKLRKKPIGKIQPISKAEFVSGVIPPCDVKPGRKSRETYEVPNPKISIQSREPSSNVSVEGRCNFSSEGQCTSINYSYSVESTKGETITRSNNEFDQVRNTTQTIREYDEKDDISNVNLTTTTLNIKQELVTPTCSPIMNTNKSALSDISNKTTTPPCDFFSLHSNIKNKSRSSSGSLDDSLEILMSKHGIDVSFGSVKLNFGSPRKKLLDDTLLNISPFVIKNERKESRRVSSTPKKLISFISPDGAEDSRDYAKENVPSYANINETQDYVLQRAETFSVKSEPQDKENIIFISPPPKPPRKNDKSERLAKEDIRDHGTPLCPSLSRSYVLEKDSTWNVPPSPKPLNKTFHKPNYCVPPKMLKRLINSAPRKKAESLHSYDSSKFNPGYGVCAFSTPRNVKFNGSATSADTSSVKSSSPTGNVPKVCPSCRTFIDPGLVSCACQPVDSEVFLIYRNGNPFEVDIHSDPFAEDKFHEEKYLRQKEIELIKWLNYVLSPPKELETITQGLDVAKLWEKACKSDMMLAPSRESVSSEYHSDPKHLFSVRKNISVLLHSPEISTVLRKMKVKVAKGLLAVKDDIHIHLDHGARSHLIQLIMMYNPLWLRIGLEAIFGQKVPLMSNNDLAGLVYFLRSNFISSDYIIKKYTSTKMHIMKPDEFKNEMNEYIVFKFLTLIFLLDRAKIEKLIPYDPCLFCKDAKFKSSEEYLNEFIKEYLKCVGQMKKSMNCVGYKLLYKQSYQDEFDFAFTDRNELRDGIRLTKAMEIILKTNDLCPKLRTPAISRLQKVHNVKLAMDALQSAGYEIVGDIAPKDIVDGHKEKMLSLLWQILYKFIGPRYEKAAIIIQGWWKKNLLKVEISRRIKEKTHRKKVHCAVIIQSWWRGVQTRKILPVLKEQLLKEKQMRAARHDAAVTIQRWYLQKRRERWAVQFNDAALKIQIWYRACKAAQLARQQFQEIKRSAIFVQCRWRFLFHLKKQKFARLQDSCAFKIQAWYKGLMLMRQERDNYLQSKLAAVKIQRWYRACRMAKIQQNQFLRMKESAIKIQDWYRRSCLVRADRHNFIQSRNSAIAIQSWYRNIILGRKCRQDYLDSLKAASLIQNWYRAICLAREERQNYLKIRSSTLKIQQWYHSCRLVRLEREKYLLMKKSATKIQSWYRACKAGQVERQRYENVKRSVIFVQCRWRFVVFLKQLKKTRLENSSALKIQMWYRGALLTRQERNNYLQKRRSAIKIQCWYRACRLAQIQRNHYLTVRNSVILIQDWYRRCCIARDERQHFLNMKSAATVIQMWYRSTLLTKQCREEFIRKVKAARRIQCWYRAMSLGHKQRQRFLEMKSSAVKVQNWYRAISLGHKQRQEFLEMRISVIKVQNWYRAVCLGRKQRQHFLEMRSSAIKIQNWYRAMSSGRKQRQKFLEMRSSAVKIQSWYKAVSLGRKERQEFLEMKRSAVKVQNWYKATCLGRKQRQDFLEMRQSAVKIQRVYRAVCLGREQRQEFLQIKISAIKIQNWYKAICLGRKQRQNFLEMRRSAIKIQHLYRAVCLGRKQRRDFLEMKSAAIKIQNWYKAICLGFKQRQNFLEMRQSAFKIQRMYRAVCLGRKQRQEFLEMRSAAVKIQNWCRAIYSGRKQRKEYLEIKNSTIEIQKWYRRCCQARKDRNNFLVVRQAVCKIQTWYKACRERNLERRRFVEIKQSAIFVQNRWRFIVLSRQIKIAKLQESSASKIQTWYRGVVLMRQERKNFLHTKVAVMKIQCWYRACRSAQIQRSNYLVMKESAIKIQDWYWRCCLLRSDRHSYLEIKRSVSYVQCRWRFLVHLRKRRLAKIQNSSAYKIQTWYKRALLMQQERDNFLQTRAAAIKIQKWYRRCRLARIERMQFIEVKNASITIQRWYRNILIGRKCRQEYLNKVCSAIKIQEWYRAQRLVRIERNHFLEMRKSSIKIQDWYRCCILTRKARNELLESKKSTIEEFYYPCKEETESQAHLDVTRYVSFIQCRWRFLAHQRRLKVAQLQDHSASIIQNWYRRVHLMRQERNNALKLKSAATKIQLWYRACLRRKERLAHEKRVKSAAVIQSAWRGYATRKKLVAVIKKAQKNAIKAKKEVAHASAGFKELTLEDRFLKSMDLFRKKHLLSDVIVLFNNLDIATKYSRSLCQKLCDVEDFFPFSWDILNRSARCDNYQGIFTHCLNTFIHLAQSSPNISERVWQSALKYCGVTILLKVMGKFTQKSTHLYCKGAVLLCIFGQDPEHAKIMKKSPDFLKTLNFFHHKLVPKLKKKGDSLQRGALDDAPPSSTPKVLRIREMGNPEAATVVLFKVLNIQRPT